MEFEKINLDTWERAPLYTYFMENMRNVMSMTAEADATRVFRRAEADGLKVYPALTWLVTKTVNSIENFRYALAEDGSLIRWKSLSPYFAHFQKEDGNFIKLVCDYDEDVSAFCARFDRLREETKDKKWFECKFAQKNTFDVTCLPWTHYKSFDVHVFDEGRYLAPVVSWGRAEERNGRLVLPVSCNIHHAVADGRHLCLFFERLQEEIDRF